VRRTVIRGVLSAALAVGLLVGALPRIADVSEVWRIIQAMSWSESVTLSVVALWNLVGYWFVLVAALPGLSLRRAAVLLGVPAYLIWFYGGGIRSTAARAGTPALNAWASGD